MLDADPALLHMAGGTLSVAADDAASHLAASTGADCSLGFPGTCAAAHSALVGAWQQEDRALIAEAHTMASELHQSAAIYVATDHTNADLLQPHLSVTPPISPPIERLNL